MGNLSFISSRRHIRIPDIYVQLQDINRRRFGGFFTITPVKDFEDDGVVVTYDGERPLTTYWKHSARRLSSSVCCLMWQAWVVVHDETLLLEDRVPVRLVFRLGDGLRPSP